jgi:hypothetical protein
MMPGKETTEWIQDFRRWSVRPRFCNLRKIRLAAGYRPPNVHYPIVGGQ